MATGKKGGTGKGQRNQKKMLRQSLGPFPCVFPENSADNYADPILI